MFQNAAPAGFPLEAQNDPRDGEVTATSNRTVDKLLRQQAALASFGSFAFREPDLLKILSEAARICAASFGVPFCKVCRYRAEEDDLLIEAGCGWHAGVIGRVVSRADKSSPQGRAFITGEPVIIGNLAASNTLDLPAFYPEHGIVSTVDVVIPGFTGRPYGVLEIDSPAEHLYDIHDIAFLTGFANVLAEAVATTTRVAALQALVEEKNLLAEELQHRVRNNLQMVTSMLTSYARTASYGGAPDGIDAIARQVSTLAQVYDSLLGVGLSASIDLGEYLRALCQRLPGMQRSHNDPVVLVCRADRLVLPLDVVTGLGMVVAELVTNSYGHGFPDRGGTINVVLNCQAANRATLTVGDDGVGFAVQRESDRRGMKLVQRLMARLGGTVDVASEHGTLWTLGLPAIPNNSAFN